MTLERRGGVARLAVVACAVLAVVGLSACAGARKARPIVRDAPPPAYEEVAHRYNERIDRLDRIWARANVSLKYVDDRGRRQAEHGDGHFQLRRPDGVALSIGKLGETYAWLGADDQRFWFFDKFDEPRVVVGRHENLNRPCADPLGLPVDPLQMLDLMGVTALPIGADGRTEWSADGRSIIARFAIGDAIETLRLDVDTLLPSRIELGRAGEEGSLIVATLERYEPVRLRDEGGFFPRIASRVQIDHPSSETQIVLRLSDMEDGRSHRGRLIDAAFDFNALMGSFAPTWVEVLDADCSTPALTSP